MILSQYLIGPGFVPQRLPQQRAAGTRKSMLIGSHLPPPPASIVGRYRYLDGPCSDCQRATSAPLTAYVGMKPEQLNWAGEIVHYESSPKIFRGFCPSCGTRLYFRSEGGPTFMFTPPQCLIQANINRARRPSCAQGRNGWISLSRFPPMKVFISNHSLHERRNALRHLPRSDPRIHSSAAAW